MPRHEPQSASSSPCLARNAQHGALAGAGIANDDTEIAAVGDVLQRLCLLSGKRQSAPPGMGQSCQSILLVDGMPATFRHYIGSAMQALFGFDHLVRGKTIFSTSILAEFDQVGCIADGAHHLVELVDAVAVAMGELGHVTAGERRLLLRDSVQRDRWIGNDARAIVARDLAVQFGAICNICGLDSSGRNADVMPLNLDAFCRCADLALWLKAIPCASRLR